MSDELADVLAAVKDRKRRIDELDSQLSERIKVIETALRKHVNIRVDVRLTDQESLAFGKNNGQWHLLVLDADGTETVLASCSRERRVRVFAEQGVDRLLASAVLQIEDSITQRQTALAKAAALIAALEKSHE